MTKHVLTVLAYVFATFLTQGVSHFALATDHYATVSYLRAEPILAFGFLAMLIQGTILSVLYRALSQGQWPLRKAIAFSLTMGAFLASYIAFGEAGKYAVPSVPAWLGVELAAACVQFLIFGVLLGLIYRPAVLSPAPNSLP
jgi:hypothetical protein